MLLLLGNPQSGPPPPPTPPSLSLSVSPSSVVLGQSALLIWSAANATSCVASGGWSGAQPVSGSASTGTLSQTTTFTLTAIGQGGSVSQTVTVAVTVPAPIDNLQAQILTRLQRLIPNGWFSVGLVPLRDALLSGIANALAFCYSLFAYVRLQTRIATATDGWLDMISADFFGTGLPRESGETGTRYRTRILANLLLERGTRPAMVQMLTVLTGLPPVIVEPWRPADTGAYSVYGGYGVAGAYGSLNLPYQAFMTVYRPIETVNSLANVIPYGKVVIGSGYLGSGGYGVGATEYAPAAALGNAIDSDIYNAIAAMKPEGTVVWARITNPPVGT